MQANEGFEAAAQRAARACAGSVAALSAAGVASEHLAEYVPPRRQLLWTRAATMLPLGEVWRIGTLLLGTDGELYAAGRATRAAERGRPGYQSLSREERRDIAAAALKGGFAAGAPVNFDARRITLDASELAGLPADLPVGFADGEVRVRWRAGAPLTGAPTLAAFLADRVSLLVKPPFSE